MKRLVRIGIVSLAAAVVLFAAFHYMRAQGERSPNAVQAPQPHSAFFGTNGPSSKPVPHTLLTTYITQGFAVGTVEAGGDVLPVDNPTTFKCCFHEGCALEIEQSVQVCFGSSANNWWALVVQVDGANLAYSPYVGEVPSDGSCVLVTSNQSTPVTHGTHTVGSFVVSFYGLTLEDSHINYRVYAP